MHQLPKSVSLLKLIDLVPEKPLQPLHDVDVELTHVATPQQAKKGGLAFIKSTKTREIEQLVNASEASVMVVDSAFDKDSSKIIIKAKNPFLWFSQALHTLFPDLSESDVHPSAEIHPSARIGESVFIGPNCVIDENVTIGNNVRIGAGTYVGPNTEIGSNCVFGINNNIGVMGLAVAQNQSGQFESRIPHLGCVRIEGQVEVGAGCCIVRGILEDTTIASGVRIGNLVNVGHHCVIEEDCWLSSSVLLAGSVRIGRGAKIGASATIGNHLKVGEGAQVGLGAVVCKHVEPGMSVFGVPAEPMPTMRKW